MGNEFEEELNLIQDTYIKEWTRQSLNNAPSYFWTAQASSTGKYHPQCTCKVGGLLIHVKRAVYIGNRLCEGWDIVGIDKDIIISALLLHDIAKVPNKGDNYEDYINHPLNAEKYFVAPPPGYERICEKIKGAVQHHMGLYSPASNKKPLKNYTKIELVTYTSDYIAATKEIITPKDNG